MLPETETQSVSCPMFGVCVFEYTFLTANTLPASAGAALAGHLYPYVCHAGLRHKQAVTMATAI